MSFQTWGEQNQSAKDILRPNFGLRTWQHLSVKDRNVIWQHLMVFFFDKNRDSYDSYGEGFYPFTGSEDEQQVKRERIGEVIKQITNRYKAKNYAPKFLEKRTYLNACSDFREIFMIQTEHVVIELLSLYAKAIID